MMLKRLIALSLLLAVAGVATVEAADYNRLGVALKMAMTTAGDFVQDVRVNGDVHPRFRLFTDGKQEFGSGSATPDTNLYRTAANVLGTDDSFDIVSHDASAIGLKLAGTLVTSTAAELNILDGATATVAELNYLDITTLGTGAASKAVVLDASGDYTYPSTATIVYPASSSLTLAASSTFAVATTAAFTGDVTGDGGDQFYGFLQDQVASTTTSVTAAQAGKTFVSNSADVMTLPEASSVLGARYTFVCGTADDFTINPADGTDQIGVVASITGTNTTTTLAPAAGDSITCTDIGSSITLEAVGADLWISVGNANGIWTDTD